MVFSGCVYPPESHCSSTDGGAFTTIDKTPVIAEKLYISQDEEGNYFLNVPRVEKDKVGTT